MRKKNQLWIGRGYWGKWHIYSWLYDIEGRQRIWSLKGQSVPFRNVESTKGKNKDISETIGHLQWHRQETNYYGDAKKTHWVGALENVLVTDIFEMNFQGWIEL